MQTPPPKISVIVPIYNVEPWLADCLESLVGQTFREFEVLCVDDASTDRSAEIAADYASRYPYIYLIRKEHSGLSSTRNAALDIARGEYLCFLDSDDLYAPGALEGLWAEASSRELDLLLFNGAPFCESEDIQEDYRHYVHLYHRTGDYSELSTGQTLFSRMYQAKEFLTSVCLLFCRRALLQSAGLRFYPGILHEDNLFVFQCLLRAKRAGYLNEPYYQRRVRPGSIMTTKRSMRNVEGYLVCYWEMLRDLQRVPVEEEARSAISRRLYAGIFRNACRIYRDLPPSERGEQLSLDHPAAQELLLIVKHFTDAETARNRARSERDRLSAESTALKAAHDRLLSQQDQLTAQREGLKAENKELKRALKEAQRALAKSKEQADRSAKAAAERKKALSAIKSSPSYQLGRALTAPFRFLKGLWKGAFGGKR